MPRVVYERAWGGVRYDEITIPRMEEAMKLRKHAAGARKSLESFGKTQPKDITTEDSSIQGEAAALDLSMTSLPPAPLSPTVGVPVFQIRPKNTFLSGKKSSQFIFSFKKIFV